ncbi:hypothetical protein JX265_000985 [Neoarthrinium moseri]|uniref:Uncharacterized protein n=1 Tax=Neoarthrinium moseri TaxID=1658444 RepID=A0A9P9WWY4_9PEZI|nr:hypothetical protein JX265_000985 [Neoarthrinium moseri]
MSTAIITKVPTRLRRINTVGLNAAFSTTKYRSQAQPSSIRSYVSQLISGPRGRICMASGLAVVGLIDYEIWMMYSARNKKTNPSTSDI